MTQNGYMDFMDSMAAQTDGCNIPHVLETMSQRYMGANPPHGPVYRVTRASPIRKLADHTYEFPIGRLYPEMQAGQRVYAWARLWAEEAQEFIFALRAHGSVKLYHNGEKRFGSSPEEEGAAGPLLKLKINLSKGWNHFLLELGKNKKGAAGACFGTGNRKNKPLHFLAPSLEREGEEGWIYTSPQSVPLSRIPQAAMPEAETGLQWLPERSEGEQEQGAADFAALYGSRPGQAVYAWTQLANPSAARRTATIAGTARGPLVVEWQGRLIYETDKPGPFTLEVEAAPGPSQLVLRCSCGKGGWGFTLEEPPEGLGLKAPKQIHGYRGSWLYLGPFAPSVRLNPADYMGMDKVAPGADGDCYWTAGEPDAHVRPFLENELFGRWNYPLGVTLFGLLESSRQLGRADMAEYVARHGEFATSMYEYSLWDRDRFGAAGLNNQLSHVDSLDDCGSFGALAILADRIRPLRGARRVFDDIARYVTKEQDRMEDGALYRKIGVSVSMHNTMWCDDMYMSVPFLCRYSECTGDPAYRDEAARQLLLYKKYLYMPRLQVMSHVFDVAEGSPSGTVWGRGNGWVFFSLSVLLEVLPEDHGSYREVLAFYRELAQGYLRLQGPNGLWHQVLTDHESYEESSCTSMFMYGFARGVRFGWLEDQEPYAAAALEGWQGLCGRAIDKRGNLYGVCKGSSWSYSHSYYKHDLGWNLNDTHGIGIVLLAGIEAERMKEFIGLSDKRKGD